MDIKDKLDELEADAILESRRPKKQEGTYGYLVAYKPEQPHEHLGAGCFRIMPCRDED